MRYFAAFTTGIAEIISNRLNRFANADLVVRELQDGLVIFDSSLSINQLTELRFFNNVYGLVADLGKQDSIGRAAYQAAVADMANVPKTSFKIHVRVANQPVALAALNDLQAAVADRLGAQPDSFKPGVELLLLMRQDGRTLWGWQLPRPGFKKRRLGSGELRPELAHAMGLLAGLNQKHTVLDPFAGYGAIVRECLQGFHARQVIAIEYNEHLVPHLKSIPHLIAKHGDAARLPHVQTRSIDRVITDPPWGKYEHASIEHLKHLYHESFVQMHRVLRTKGCVVMLTALPEALELAGQVGFELEKQYQTLVNGQKAVLYKFRKA